MGLPSGIYVSGQGPAVVLLHSSLSTAKQWSPLLKALRESYTCINCDLLGYGKADTVPDNKAYDLNVETQRILSAIEHVIGEQPFHLVGHSFGGAIALKLALEHQSRVLSLSMHEPVAFHLLAQGSVERKESDDFAASVEIEDNYLAAEIFTNYWNKKGFFKELPAKLQSLMANDMNKVRLDFQGLMAETYTLDDLKHLSFPCLVTTGESSPRLGQFLAESVASAIPASRFEITRGGHMAPITHALEVQRSIADFIFAK